MLGDGLQDKYEFRTACVPPPDGVTSRFFCGQTRVVDGSLSVFIGSTLTAPSGVAYLEGVFTMNTAAPSGVEVQASFYYQWFTDAELTSFVEQAAQLLNFTGVDDTSLPAGVRPGLLQYAAYFAYMRKAAEFAEALEASAQGYTIDRSKAGPNWRALAEASKKAGKELIDMYNENSVAASDVRLSFITYSLPYYGPRS